VKAMYRLSIEKEDWIVRFSPHLAIEKEEKDAIVNPLMNLGNVLSSFSHGDSFIIINEKIGVIICRVERIPSLILIISTIVPKENWFIQTDSTINRYNSGKFH
jgi:hypothetical protein